MEKHELTPEETEAVSGGYMDWELTEEEKMILESLHYNRSLMFQLAHNKPAEYKMEYLRAVRELREYEEYLDNKYAKSYGK